MQKVLFLSFFLFTSLLTSAQPDYREGFVILLNGDTIRGYIDYHRYTPCRFKKSAKQRGFSEYSAEDLKGYGFSSGRFLLSKSYYDKKKGKIKGFINVLLLGEVSLYTMKGKMFIEAADTILSLNQNEKKVISTKKKGPRVFYSKRHVGILRYLLKDCPAVSEKLPKVKGDPQKIMEILKEYHECKGIDYSVFIDSTPPIRVNFGVEAGMVGSRLYYSSFFTEAGAPYSPRYLKTYSFSPAGNLYISWPRTRDRFSIVLGVQYIQGNYPVKVQFQQNDVIYHAESIFKAKRLKIPFGFHYDFSKGAVSPFVGLGFLSAIKLSSSSEYIFEIESGDVVDTYTGKTSPFFDRTANIWLAAGVKVKITKKLKGYAGVRVEGPYSTREIAGEPGEALYGNMYETSFTLGVIF